MVLKELRKNFFSYYIYINYFILFFKTYKTESPNRHSGSRPERNPALIPNCDTCYLQSGEQRATNNISYNKSPYTQLHSPKAQIKIRIKSPEAQIRPNIIYSSVSPEMGKKEGWVTGESFSEVWDAIPKSVDPDIALWINIIYPNTCQIRYLKHPRNKQWS